MTIGACGLCNPKGFIDVGNCRYEPCKCSIEYGRLKKLHDSGLPRNYWEKDYSHINEFSGDQAALATVKDYLGLFHSNQANGVGLYFYGKPGIGKTLLAAYVLHYALQQNKNAKFYYFTDILNTFTESWHDDNARNEVEKNILNSDLLVLDDLGKEYQSNKKLHESILDTVIRSRASQLKPVIITSNYDIFDVKEKYGHGIVDLFKESLTVVNVKGSSYRQTKMDEKKNQ